MAERDAERPDGFYWVRSHWDLIGWTVAKWYHDDGDWLMISDDDSHGSEFFLEIDERRIVRQPE